MKRVSMLVALVAVFASLAATTVSQAQQRSSNTRSYRSYSYNARRVPFRNGTLSFGRRDAGSKARSDYAPYHGGNFVP